MPLESLAAIATIAGTAVSVLAVVQSIGWLALVSLAFVLLSVGFWLWGRHGQVALKSASVVIEGHSIDALNVANLRRRVSRTFVIQEAHHTVRIKGEDMEITWRYSGFCKVDDVSFMEFSIDSEVGTMFEQLNCFAYDLGRDADMKHQIRPTLIGADGISKKISVAFLEPLNMNQSFSLLLCCTLPRCMKPGFGYYTSTFSFAQSRVQRCVVHLVFAGDVPLWVRVYESSPRQPNRLIKTLVPTSRDSDGCDYIDVTDNRSGRSARVYVFWRDIV
jgi:hypothetical protein